jgi:hypothetical protein
LSAVHRTRRSKEESVLEDIGQSSKYTHFKYLAYSGRLSALKARKTAAESIQVVEEIVNTETAVEQLPPSPRKRRFEEIDNNGLVPVKSERSMSAGSNSSRSTNYASMGNVKMEDEPTHSVDEETSNAASILNGVAMDRRTVFLL